MSLRKKVALFCNVAEEAVVQSIDASTIYEVPLLMQEQVLTKQFLRNGIATGEKPNLEPWKEFLKRRSQATDEVKIALVGKYVELQDAYKSILESLSQAATYNDHKLKIEYVQSEQLTEANVDEKLGHVNGVVICPGFGSRGIEGKFVAAKYTREHDIPTFGICLGMQCIAIEFARTYWVTQMPIR
jgi:CTP synthase